jgi:LuxR family quorum sensing-dependent transcriptional regulator
MSRWDETVDFTRRIQLAPTAEAICDELLALTSRYGLKGLIAGTIPAPGLSPSAQKSHILFAGYPEAWMRRYVTRSYAYVDPILRQVVADPGTAFAWHEGAMLETG